MSVDIKKLKVGDVLISRCNFQGVKYGDKVIVKKIYMGGDEYYSRGKTHISGESIYVYKQGTEGGYVNSAELNSLSLDYEWTENAPTLCKKCVKKHCLMSPQWICSSFKED